MKTKHSKIWIEVKLETLDLTGALDSVIERLESYPDTYEKHACFYIKSDPEAYGDEPCDLLLYAEREETDKEYEKRIKRLEKVSKNNDIKNSLKSQKEINELLKLASKHKFKIVPFDEKENS